LGRRPIGVEARPIEPQFGTKTDSFIRFRKLFREGQTALNSDELGDAELILHNKLYLREAARQPRFDVIMRVTST
jgi:hypothetical protein